MTSQCQHAPIFYVPYNNPRVPCPSSCPVSALSLPLSNFNLNLNLEKAVEFDSTTQRMGDITVPTPETASLSYWMNVLVKCGFPVLLAGPAGTGKTQLINGLLRELRPEERVHCTINMNYYTNAAALQVRLYTPKRSRSLRPAGTW